MFLNFHWPLPLVNLVQDLIGKQQSAPNTPQITTSAAGSASSAPQVWFSQPRSATDPTIEVLTVNFKLPLSIGEFSIEILRVSCTFQVWYQDRNNNWIQMRDESYQPMQITLSSSQEVSWYKYHVYTYQIVAKAVQFRISRNPDLILGNQPFNIGLQNGLIRRNIYALSDGTQAMEPEQDALGNVIAKYIQDWGASDAIDDEPFTFWRSAPQPDPQAVVSLYLDLRNPDGTPQLIDTLYIDPVYINQNLNLYYSVDDTVGTRNLSPVSLPPDIDENTQWTAGSGLSDISATGGTSLYQIALAIGPQLSQPVWMGIQWAPDFDVLTGAPPNNPILFGVSPGLNAVQTISIVGDAVGGSFELSLDGTNYSASIANNATGDAMQTALAALAAIGTGNVLVAGDPGGPWTVNFQNQLGQQAVPDLQVVNSLTGAPQPKVNVQTTTAGYSPPNAGGSQYWPRVYFDAGASEIALELTNGQDTQLFTVPLSPLPTQYTPMRIVVGWVYEPTPQVFLSVTRPDGQLMADSTQSAPHLPTQITLDGEVGYQDFRGNMTALVVKLGNWANGYRAFQANPAMYVNPDPVQPDPNTGIVPSTTLDDAVLAVDWTLQDTPIGGGHASFYTSKIWTPIFANYVTQKGKFYFPKPVMVKYLQLEFSNLTQESYPVYDSGIKVMYQVFPISVSQTQTKPTLGSIINGLVSIGGQILTGGIGSVNWLNPSTITAAVNSVFGQTVSPISVQVGPGYTTSTAPAIPNTLGSSASDIVPEISSPWVYRRQLPNVAVLAAQQLGGFLNNVGAQVVNPLINGIASTIAGAFSPLINFSPSSTSLPLQGSDFWVVPGQTLAIAATVMQGLTQVTSTLLNPTPDTTTRLRFTTTSVHEYQIKTAIRDAAIAYFAGIREVQAFRTTYISTQDPPNFQFNPYDPNQFIYNNIRQLTSGPISTAGITYEIQNPLFDTTLDEWDQAQGSWSVDPAMGRYHYGSAKVTAAGTEKELLSALITAWPNVTPGANFGASVWVQWQGAVTNASTQSVQLQANFYDADGNFLSQQIASMDAPGTTNMWDVTGEGGAQLTGTFQVPTLGAQIKLGLVVTPDMTAGQVWFDTVLIYSTDQVEGTTFIDLITQSTFVKVDCQFNDSGTVRSDDMWADADPLNTNISSTALAWYTDTIPPRSGLPGGTWASDNTMWADPTTVWGEPFAEVAINVDPNMTYQGKRVLHITRAAGYGEAGIAVRQVTGFVPNGLFRLNLIYQKPVADSDQIILRLRRVSDGVYIYEYTFNPNTHPGATGFWYELQTDFQELPDVNDQIYTLEAVVSGDAGGDFYINDAWVEVAQIRYFCRLGGESQFLHDVTALRYTDTAIVSATQPVNEVTMQSAILSPTAWAYSAVLTPNYLK
jgi:hypothetical protein